MCGFFPSGETLGKEARSRRRGPPVPDEGVAQTLWVPSSRLDGRAWGQGAGAGRASGPTWSPGKAEHPREAGLSRNRRARGRARWAVQGAASGSAGCSLERLRRVGFFSLWGGGLRDAAGRPAVSGSGRAPSRGCEVVTPAGLWGGRQPGRSSGRQQGWWGHQGLPSSLPPPGCFWAGR